MDLRKGAEYAEYVGRYDLKAQELEEAFRQFGDLRQPREDQRSAMLALLLSHHEAIELLAREALQNGFDDIALTILGRRERLVGMREAVEPT